LGVVNKKPDVNSQVVWRVHAVMKDVNNGNAVNGD